MDNPEGQVTYPDKQDGRATYRLWHISLYALRFYLCFYKSSHIDWIPNYFIMN